MSFKLTELYAELSVKGAPTVDAALAAVRREMIKTQRIANSLGGEMGAGMGIASELFRKSMQRNLEPQLLRMQANLLAATGKMRGWSREQGMAVVSAVAFENALGKMSFRINEVQEHAAGLTKVSKYMFGALLGGILGSTGAASPVLFKTLTDSFAWLSAEIGTIFVPYVAKAALFIQDLARWFHNLSDATKDTIAKFSLVGLGLTGIVVAGAMVLSTIANIITGIKSLVDLYILWAARSKSIVAHHMAEAMAANVAAAAEARLWAIRMGATSTWLTGPGPKRLTGPGGSPMLPGPIGPLVGTGGAALFGTGGLVAGLMILLGTEIGRLGDAVIKMTGGTGLTPDLQNNRLTRAFETHVGLKPETAAPAATTEKSRLLLALNQPVLMGPVADAWKQAQLAVLQGFGPAGEQLKIQQQQLEELLKISSGVQQLANPTVGPN